MTEHKLYAVVDYEDDYVQPLLQKVIQHRIPSIVFIDNAAEVPSGSSALLQWRQYESIEFEELMSRPTKCIANSYIIRKAMIRKHYLANTISHWLSKHPNSSIKTHIKESISFELDYAEFLDDALLEAYELYDSWNRNLALDGGAKEWWILKPGMSDKAQGIRLFSSEEELTNIFEAWDPDSDDEGDPEDESTGGPDQSLSEAMAATDIQTSHLRHFVVQPYIDPPLLLPASHESANRKFHIRTYVLAVGALKVYVFKPMLALFAAEQYTAPSDSAVNAALDAHLTNTCLQTNGPRSGAVHAFWSLPSSLKSLPAEMQHEWQNHVWKQICDITAILFEAAAKTSAVHFQPLPNAFEIFGLDFLIDAQGCAWLLEVNAFPDFAQTGPELSDLIEKLMVGVVEKAIVPFFGVEEGEEQTCEDMVEVLDLDLGRR